MKPQNNIRGPKADRQLWRIGRILLTVLLAGVLAGLLILAADSKTGNVGLTVAEEILLTQSGANANLKIRLTSGVTAQVWGDSSTACGSATGSLNESASGTHSIALNTIPFGSNQNNFVCVHSSDNHLNASVAWPHTAASVAFVQQPTTTAASATLTPAITAEILDTTGTLISNSSASVVLAFGTNAGSGTLSGTLTKSAVNGVATFNNISIDKSGTGYTLTASSTGLSTATSNTFNITGGTASKLAFTTVPGTGTAGTAFSVTVQSQDANGNPASPTSNTTITLSKATGAGTLSGTLTGIIPTSGNSVTIPTAVYSKADTMTLTATATAGQTGLTAVTSGNIVFSAGAVSASVSTVTANPASVPANNSATSTITVTLFDANSNPVSGKAVSLTAGSGSSTISAPSGNSSASGVVTFTVKDNVAQSVTYSAKDTTDNVTITSATPAVVFTASTLVVSGFSSPITAGTAGTVTVAAKDGAGNTVTGYTGTVQFTSTDGQAVLPANYTFVAGDNGTHTFTNGVTLKTSGSRSITATDTVTGTITGSQTGITVNAAAANKLVWGTQPPATVTFTTTTTVPTMTVNVQDQFGNAATSATQVTISFQANFSPAGSDVIGGTTSVSVSAGVATFSNVTASGNKPNGTSVSTFTATLSGIANPSVVSSTFKIN
ncbi:MAG TPA: Ig-like domain-containing protein [Bryobacteraceae bacterium]|nr:Ig-like domain-containing protein [Bryobacteraceae bacterium]